MTTKKRTSARKAMPSVWNVEQLDEELRVALALAQRPGLTRVGDGTPLIVTPLRAKPQKAAARRLGLPLEYEVVPWTAAQQQTIEATMAAHVANPYFGEKQDAQVIRLILGDADFDAYLAGAPTAADTVKVVRKLVRSVRALARIARGEAQ